MRKILRVISLFIIAIMFSICPLGCTSSPVPNPPAATQINKQEQTVYVTKTGSKYHRSGCQYLSKSKIPISLSEAKKSYGPCSVCNPPR